MNNTFCIQIFLKTFASDIFPPFLYLSPTLEVIIKKTWPICAFKMRQNKKGRKYFVRYVKMCFASLYSFHISSPVKHNTFSYAYHQPHNIWELQRSCSLQNLVRLVLIIISNIIIIVRSREKN